MEKSKYYLDYDLNTKKVISIGKYKNLDTALELLLDEEEFENICNNLDFCLVSEGKIIIATNSKESLNSKIQKRDRVEELKKNLENTDYKITKCYEAFMRQLPLPYNLEELATQRDAWRAEINQLELELALL